MKQQKHRLLVNIEQFKKIKRMAEAGIGNKAIMRATGATNSQITYRVGLYKRGMRLRYGLRVGWRNGEHPLLHQFLEDYGEMMDLEFTRKFLPQFLPKEPVLVAPKDKKPPTVDEAVAQLKSRKVGLP